MNRPPFFTFRPERQVFYEKKTNKSAKIYFYTCGKAKATKYVLSVKKVSVFFLRNMSLQKIDFHTFGKGSVF